MNQFTDQEATEKAALYAHQMELIKLRINVVDAIQNGKYTTPYPASNIELCCLQLRKCIELIVMASLVANADQYKAAYDHLEHDWHAKYISNDLARVSPNFYPTPIDIIKHDGEPDKFENRNPDDFITCDQLIKYYEKIGALMHSENPFGASINYGEYSKLVSECRDAIVRLLDCHLARLSDGESMLYIGMAAAEGGRVDVTYFKRVEEESTNDNT